VVGDREFFCYLLFYSARIHRCVAFELVARWAEPADVGQVAFYVTALERTLRTAATTPRSGSCWWPSRTTS
jgi:hypothetical protein